MNQSDPTRLERLIYRSEPSVTLEPAQIRDLMALCERRNAMRGLTGALIRQDGFYFQCLEGSAESLDLLMDDLLADDRHSSVMVVLRELIRERAMPAWPMVFLDDRSRSLFDRLSEDSQSDAHVAFGTSVWRYFQAALERAGLDGRSRPDRLHIRL